MKPRIVTIDDEFVADAKARVLQDYIDQCPPSERVTIEDAAMLREAERMLARVVDIVFGALDERSSDA